MHWSRTCRQAGVNQPWTNDVVVDVLVSVTSQGEPVGGQGHMLLLTPCRDIGQHYWWASAA